MDRPDVVGDVVAGDAVAAGRGPREPAAVVGERHGDAVDLQFEHPVDPLLGKEFPHAVAPPEQVVAGIGVLDRQHRQPVPDGGEFGHGLAADPLRRAVGRDEVGVLRLEGLELRDEPVVLEVADLRRRLDVVLAVVPPDLVAEPGDRLGSGLTHRPAPARPAAHVESAPPRRGPRPPTPPSRSRGSRVHPRGSPCRDDP